MREFGRAAVLAQRSPEALIEMQAEIRARKRAPLVVEPRSASAAEG